MVNDVLNAGSPGEIQQQLVVTCNTMVSPHKFSQLTEKLVSDVVDSVAKTTNLTAQQSRLLVAAAGRVLTLSAKSLSVFASDVSALPALAAQPDEFAASIKRIAEDILGEGLVAEVLDSATDMMLNSLLSQLGAEAALATVIRAMSMQAGSYVVKYGSKGMQHEVTSVLEAGDGMLEQLLSSCSKVLGRQNLLRLLVELMMAQKELPPQLGAVWLAMAEHVEGQLTLMLDCNLDPTLLNTLFIGMLRDVLNAICDLPDPSGKGRAFSVEERVRTLATKVLGYQVVNDIAATADVNQIRTSIPATAV